MPWQLNTMDAAGRVLDETLGAGVRVVTGFDSDGGRLSSRQAGVGGGNALQNLHYEWDANDNLTARRDYQQSPPVYETFTYDALDRIDSSMRNGAPNLDVNYDATGNVTSKSDVGSYTYDATKIHAVKTAGSNTYSYDANGNVVSRNGSYLGWTSYDRPSRIDNGAGTVSYLWYDAERRLWRQEAYSSGAPESTVYVGELLEKVTKDGITSWKHYVEAPTGTAAVYLRRSDGSASTYYLTHDHLGSTDKVLDAAGGIVTVAESFTALGARRGANWQGTPTPAELAAIASTTRDGFTGHVMLDNVGLVHMQGRVYDPAIGRFLSVDPVVRDVAAAQSWNGYGYVEGRVTSWTDPSGFDACPGGSRSSATCWIVPDGGAIGEFVWTKDFGKIENFSWPSDARPAGTRDGMSAGAYASFWAGQDSINVNELSSSAEQAFYGSLLQSPLASEAMPQLCFAAMASGGSAGTLIYSQTTGEMDFQAPSGDLYFLGVGYSGHGVGLNNPDEEGTPFVGPIPEGDWIIGSAYNHPSLGQLTIPLTPAPDTNTHGRDLFRIHGDNGLGNDSASAGCIVINRSVRGQIANGSIGALRVVRP